MLTLFGNLCLVGDATRHFLTLFDEASFRCAALMIKVGQQPGSAVLSPPGNLLSIIPTCTSGVPAPAEEELLLGRLRLLSLAFVSDSHPTRAMCHVSWVVLSGLLTHTHTKKMPTTPPHEKITKIIRPEYFYVILGGGYGKTT